MAELPLDAFLTAESIATLETHVQRLRQDRFALLLALLSQPRGLRLLATLGIVAATVGLYVPCAGRELLFHSHPIRRYFDTWAFGDSVRANFAPLYMAPMSLEVYLGVEVVYAVLTLGSLALIPVLWQPLSHKGTAMVRWMYAVWLVLLVILAVAGLPAWQQFMSQAPEGPSPGMLTMEASSLLPGLLVFPLGVLLNGAALCLMVRKPLALVGPAPAPCTGWQWTASLLLTAGALLWGVGFYLMPEAVTAACPPVIFSVTQLAHGACAGLDSDQVRKAAYYAGLNPVALLIYSLSWNYQLLVAAACITTLGGWTRRLSVSTLAWLAVWPVLALGGALVALQGAGVIAQHGFVLTATTAKSTWRVGPGMVVTFVGIGLVALGQGGLWRERAQELARRKGSAHLQ